MVEGWRGPEISNDCFLCLLSIWIVVLFVGVIFVAFVLCPWPASHVVYVAVRHWPIRSSGAFVFYYRWEQEPAVVNAFYNSNSNDIGKRFIYRWFTISDKYFKEYEKFSWWYTVIQRICFWFLEKCLTSLVLFSKSVCERACVCPEYNSLTYYTLHHLKHLLSQA